MDLHNHLANERATMISRILVTTFLPLFLLGTADLSASPLPTALQGGKEKAKALVFEANRLPLEKAWEVLPRIEDLEISEDTLMKSLREAAEEAGPVGKLIAARALLNLDEDGTQSKRAVEIVSPLLDPKQELDVRKAAAAMLGTPDLGPTARKLARTSLLKVLKDDTEDQGLRILAARSLHFVGRAEQVDYARRVLLDFLRSKDRELKIDGALALAEIGDMISARAILEEIEEEPTAKGSMARSYLRLEQQASEHERAIRRLQQRILQTRMQGGQGEGQSSGRFELLDRIYDLIQRYHMDAKDLDETVMVEDAAKGMMKALDRFSSYMTSDAYRAFAFDLGRLYGGIGAFVNVQHGVFQITRPIYSGPAYKAGLMSGDQILKVGNWSTMDQELDDIIKHLKGEPGTPVTISVFRAGWTEPREITLERKMIQVPSVQSLLLPGNIGYCEIQTFASDTGREVELNLLEMQKKGAKGFILDLRNNTGGYMSQAQAICDLFLPKGKVIVSTKSTIGRDERYLSRRDEVFKDVPVVVLVNQNSASASEIVTGCLKDHKRAEVVGVQTYGKGSVQNLFRIPGYLGEQFEDLNNNRRWDEGEPFKDTNKNNKYDPGPRARITISYYYLPSGRRLHKMVDSKGKIKNPDYGVEPDVTVKAQAFKTKDLWKNSLIADLLTEGKFKEYVDKHLTAENKDLFLQLAISDEGDWKKYPGFEDYYKSLDTQLSMDEVRKWVRIAVREKVADFRGKAWPGGRIFGDYQEDVQLQGAIAELLKKIDGNAAKIAAYQSIWKYTPEKKKAEKVGKKG